MSVMWKSKKQQTIRCMYGMWHSYNRIQFRPIKPKGTMFKLYCKQTREKRADRAISARRRTKAYIVASIICLIPLIIFIASSTTATSVGESFWNNRIWFSISLSFIRSYFSVILWRTCFWCILLGDYSYCRMPGVIFTLDIGGIIFLITVKLALAILSFCWEYSLPY